MAENGRTVTAELQLHQRLARKGQDYYEQAKELAGVAVNKKAFGDDRRQMRSLETLAFRARSPVDVFAFIKSQTGKEGKKEGWRYNDFGRRLLTHLEELKGEATELVQQVYGNTQDAGRLLEVHLELVRLYIRHLVSQYLYDRPQEETTP